ncbi:class I SAM-dependent methyltransferase [Saccharothrix violaceirubra]|uniref:SAM-dependent methyltransferase n=1 Tax=Saccharothrix violaceirubra TaxID=413306 RepID=A0A7W7T299_9PSEU|nr:class I SAM-dependent methyltransferase [Saccharothrix violaceirubra]MBB4965203.1 SAM-dependent methyltransferase [Saccharothrix violaceirubra]
MGITTALAALTRGDREEARTAATHADGLLARALARHLSGPAAGHVYDQPAAFGAFIAGGGNVGLYAAVVDVLAATYATRLPDSLLDVGCGDGRALVPALHRGHRPDHISLVEPSAALLAAAERALIGPVVSYNTTVQDFLTATRDRFDLVQSTFALHALPHDERDTVLAALRPRTDVLAVVEFDVPDLAHGTPGHLEFLADAYERGLAEYEHEHEGDLVAQGFLMPVLTGQLLPGAVRATWEQPADSWARQVAKAGFADVTTTRLHDYWWSPAFLLTARGGPDA